MGSIITGIKDIKVEAIPILVFAIATKLQVIPRTGPRIVPITVAFNAEKLVSYQVLMSSL